MYTLGGELKPCPFCGCEGAMFEDVRYRHVPEESWFVFGAKCTNPDCIMHQQQKFYPYEQAARDAWNRRADKAAEEAAKN